jgi:hypothetical protein
MGKTAFSSNYKKRQVINSMISDSEYQYNYFKVFASALLTDNYLGILLSVVFPPYSLLHRSSS